MSNFALGALLALYPLAVFFGADVVGLGTLAGLLAAGLLLRLMIMPIALHLKCAGVLLVLAIASFWLLHSDERWLTLHPVVLNVCLLALFGGSLVRGTPMIERIARVRKMDVGEHNLGYLRRLTAIWAAFFALASIVSIATVIHGDRGLWTLWNGVLVYVGIGALTLGELIVRRRFKARLRRQGVNISTKD